MFHHLRLLSRRHAVTVGTLVDGAADQRHVAALERMLGPNGRLWAVRQPRWRRAAGVAAALGRGRPLSIGYFHNRELASAVRRGIEAGDFDLVIVFSSTMAAYVEAFDGVARIMNFCDVDSQKWSDLAAISPWLEARTYRREARLLARHDVGVADRFGHACFVTQAEADLFRAMMPRSTPAVVRNGVDVAHFSALPRRPKARSIAFVGVMDYAPNVEAVCRFAETIFPGLRTRFPDCELAVVGSRPRAVVRALGRQPGIRVTGRVEDVRVPMSEASLVVAPLAVARGIQNKVLEAAAAGIPVMITPEVATGLPEELRAHLMIHPREPSCWIEAIAAVFDDPGPAEAQAKAARAVLERDFTWEAAVDALEALAMRAVANGSAGRAT